VIIIVNKLYLGSGAVEKSHKKAILAVSSGTVNEKARKENIEAVEKEIEKNFCGYEVRRAFSSEKIINKLMIRFGIQVDRPVEALSKLKDEAFEEVIIQPLHIIAGDEYESVQNKAESYKAEFKSLKLGRPLLSEAEDYSKVLDAIKGQLPELSEHKAAVFMGHGSSHSADESYITLQNVIDKENLNIFIGTISGKLTITSIIDRLKKKNIEEIILMPLMLVAGNHAIKDMAAEKSSSWKSMFEAEGFKVEVYLWGLGENKKIQKLYVEKLKAAILG
jgi:sirohydrochlorin cobaltochelatase